eukprot:s1397_g2.t1
MEVQFRSRRADLRAFAMIRVIIHQLIFCEKNLDTVPVLQLETSWFPESKRYVFVLGCATSGDPQKSPFFNPGWLRLLRWKRQKWIDGRTHRPENRDRDWSENVSGTAIG